MTCNLTAEVREKCPEHGYIHGRLDSPHDWSRLTLPPCYARGVNALKKPAPKKKLASR
jgi:hypothetical protein